MRNILFALVLIVALVACDKNNTPTPTPTQNSVCNDSIYNYDGNGAFISSYPMDSAINNCKIVVFHVAGCHDSDTSGWNIVYNGNLIASEEKGSTNYAYYYNGLNVDKKEYYYNSSLQNYWKYTYDSKGRINRQYYYFPNDTLIETRVFNYCN